MSTQTWNKAKEKTAPDTLNKEGVPAYSEPPEFELAAMLLASFGVEDAFYESGNEKLERLKGLLSKVSPEFQAQCAFFARHEMNMRSLPRFVAANVLLTQPNAKWKRAFFGAYPVRADDPLEIIGAAEVISGSPFTKFPKFLQKGFGDYLSSLDEYQIAKYSINTSHKQKGRRWNLIDLVNLCHPKATDALTALVKGKLQKADTHEASVSAKVNAALESAEEGADKDEIKADAKREDWERLILDGRLGYMALLKNLRNCLLNGVNKEARDAMFAQLIDPKRVAGSRVIPFRYLSAYKAIEAMGGRVEGASEALMALSVAIKISLGNVDDMSGSVVILDESGSMRSNYVNVTKGRRQEPWQLISCAEIGVLFAATMAAKGADVVFYETTARHVRLNPADSLFAAINKLGRGGSTNLPAAFDILKAKYDQIIILSDHQRWVGEGVYGGETASNAALSRYKNRTGADPMVFSWTLVPYGTQAIRPDRVRFMAGWSDKALEQLKWARMDKNGLVNKIKEIDLNALRPKNERRSAVNEREDTGI